MRKKVIALALCMAIVSLSAVTLSAAPPKKGTISFRTLLEKPWNLLVSLFPSLGNPSHPQEPGETLPGNDDSLIVKPMEQGVPVIRLNDRD